MENRQQDYFGYTIGVWDVLLFIWTLRRGLLIGALIGAFVGAVLKFKSSPQFYKSTFVIDLDEDSLPAITGGQEVAQEVRNIINSPASLRQVVFNVLGMSKMSEAENKSNDIVLQKTSAYVDAYYSGSKKEGKGLTFTDRTFDIVPSEDSLSYVVIAKLPVTGVQTSLGEAFVNNLNSMIARKNTSIMATHRKMVQESIIELNKVVGDANATNKGSRIDMENKLISVKSEIASIEYQLSSLAMPHKKIQDFLAFTSYNDGSNPGRTFASPSPRPDLSIRFALFGLENRLENIVKLLSALESENKIDKESSSEFRKRIATMLSAYSNSMSIVRSQDETELTLARSLNEIQKTSILDKRKLILPTFKLNKQYYESAKGGALEIPVYSQSRDLYLLVGASIGSLLLSLLIVTNRLLKSTGKATSRAQIFGTIFQDSRAK